MIVMKNERLKDVLEWVLAAWVTIANSFSHNTSSQFCKARRFGRVAPVIFKYATKKKKENANLLSTGTLSRTIWKVWYVVVLELWERHIRCRCRCFIYQAKRS